MPFQKRTVGLLIVSFMLLMTMISLYYGNFQNLFFVFLLMYLMSSLFLKPRRERQRVPEGKKDSWSSFDIEDEDMPDMQEDAAEDEASRFLRELYYGKGEETPAYVDGGERDRSATERDEGTYAKTKMKDWGTILYEKINESSKKTKRVEKAEDNYEGEYIKRAEKEVDPWELFKSSFKLNRQERSG